MRSSTHGTLHNRNSSSAEKGRDSELKCKAKLEADGYVVLRTENPHGFADLFAIRPRPSPEDGLDRIRVIQCKTRKASRREYECKLEDILGVRIEVWTGRWSSRSALYSRFNERRVNTNGSG